MRPLALIVVLHIVNCARGGECDGKQNICTCERGYQLNSTDLKSCYAVQECNNYQLCKRLCGTTGENLESTCAEGYTLSGECEIISCDVFLLCSRIVEIRALSLDDPDSISGALPLYDLLGVVGVDYHPHLNSVFWTDILHGTINTARINGSNQQELFSGLTTPAGITVDWLAHRLYWTEKSDNSIKVGYLDGMNYQTLIQGGMKMLRDIVVHPEKKILFWTAQGKIERANVDGNYRVTIASVSNKLYGLALDFDREHIYWCAYSTTNKISSLEYANFDGSQRTILRSEVPNSKFFGLSIYGEYLYLTDKASTSIKIIHKITGEGLKTIVGNLQRVGDIQVFSQKQVHDLQSQPVIFPSSSKPATTSFVLNFSSTSAALTRNEMFSTVYYTANTEYPHEIMNKRARDSTLLLIFSMCCSLGFILIVAFILIRRCQKKRVLQKLTSSAPFCSGGAEAGCSVTNYKPSIGVDTQCDV